MKKSSGKAFGFMDFRTIIPVSLFSCLMVFAFMLPSTSFSADVSYYGDGTIRSIGDKNVSYYGDGTIRSIGDKSVSYYGDGTIRSIGDKNVSYYGDGTIRSIGD